MEELKKEEIKTGLKAEVNAETQEQTETGPAVMVTKPSISLTDIGYPNFFTLCLLFAVFYVFCRFENLVGLFYPVFILGIEAVYLFFMKQTGEQVKKDSYFYLAAALLLAVSTSITDNSWIWVYNKIGIWLLFGITLLHNSYDDREWRFMKYLGNLFGLLFSLVGNLFTVFSYRKMEKKKREHEATKKKQSQLPYILTGVAIAIPLLFIILSLLSSADAVFSNLLMKLMYLIFREIVVPIKFIQILIMYVFGVLVCFSAGYCIRKKGLNDQQPDLRKQEPVTAITFTSIIAVVYLVFCSIQISYLFRGGMILPQGYTYSAYARQGFFQLLFVCVINLIMVLLCMGLFRDNKTLKIVLTVISGCTYIMTASSFYRMLLYIKAYQLTRLRILVLAALFVIAILLAGVIRTIYNYHFPLFQFGTAVVTCVYVVLSLSRIDAVIARYNIDQKGFEITWENQYITTLSADAAPIFADAVLKGESTTVLASEKLDEYFRRISYYEDMNYRTINLSRYYGKKAAVQYFSQK